jgi:thiamine-monophosphate kinase
MSETIATRTRAILAHGSAQAVGYNRSVKVSDLGEFGLIERLEELLAAQGKAAFSERLVVGIGDDAAVWRADDRAIVATTDTLVAGVHFLPARTSWRDTGWKALAVNVSDIAAMGATPEFALVTLGLPADSDAEAVDDIYRGLAEAGDEYGVVIAGGDIVRAPELFVSVALCGRAELDASGEPAVLRRSAAVAGDLVAVTGSLGGAAGGLRLLRDGDAGSEAARALIERQCRPQARLAAGQAALAAGVRCAIDVSDGLLQDLQHICQMSRTGAVVWRDKLPVDHALAGLFDADEALALAASGGEDYELLITGSREQIDAVARRIDVPLTVIGEVVIDPSCAAKLLDEHGKEIKLKISGWDHLKGHS